MARNSGRNPWIAWPAGVLCVAVVGALAWLSQPMIPIAAAWTGQMFYSATHMPRPAPAPETVANRAMAPEQIDCRALYPDDLWAELTWTPDALLRQDFAPPATSVTTLTDALVPDVRVSCHWRAPSGGTIASTLARVAADASPVAEAALIGQGFDCAVTGPTLSCSRTQGDVVEEQTVRDGIWLSSVATAWHPTGYGSRLAAHVWGQ